MNITAIRTVFGVLHDLFIAGSQYRRLGWKTNKEKVPLFLSVLT